MNIYHIVGLVLLNSTGFKGVRILNTLYALELGASPFDIGVLLATYALFPLLLAVYAGKVADRYGVRLPLLAGMIGMTFGIFFPFVVPTLPVLYFASALIGAGFIFVQVSMQALTGTIGGPERRTHNFNLYSLGIAVTDLIGPVLAGFSIDHFGHVPTYLYLTCLNVVAAAAAIYFLARVPRFDAKSPDAEAQRTIDLVKDRDLRRTFMASAVVMTGIDMFQLYLPLHARAVGLSASAIGLILGAFAAAAFVVRAAIPILVRRLSEEVVLIYAIFLAAATYLIFPLFSGGVVLGAIAFVLGLGLGLGQPLSTILTYNYSPPGRAGEALGLRIAVNNFTHVAVPVVFGAIGSAFGLSPVFWANSVFLAAGGYASLRRPAGAGR